MEADRKRKHLYDLMEKKRAEAATKIKEAYRNWKAKNKKKKKKKKWSLCKPNYHFKLIDLLNITKKLGIMKEY